MLGSDDALKREALLKLTGPLLDPSFADFDREERDIPPTGAGEAGEAARAILASAGGVPMASERRVVVVTNVHRLGKEDQDALAAGLPKLGDLSCLVLIAGGDRVRRRVRSKAARRSGQSWSTPPPKPARRCCAMRRAKAACKSRANALLKERGKTIEPAALALIMDRAKATASERGGGGKTGDINVLLNELEKAIAHAGDRAQVTRADAVAVGLHTVQDNIFTLLDAVGHRDPRRALAEADNLLEAGDKPDGVAARTFVMLARHLRQVWGAKYLADQRLNGFNIKGGLPPEVQAVLSGEMLGITQRQSYRLKDLQEQARGWTYPALARRPAPGSCQRYRHEKHPARRGPERDRAPADDPGLQPASSGGGIMPNCLRRGEQTPLPLPLLNLGGEPERSCLFRFPHYWGLGGLLLLCLLPLVVRAQEPPAGGRRFPAVSRGWMMSACTASRIAMTMGGRARCRWAGPGRSRRQPAWPACRLERRMAAPPFCSIRPGAAGRARPTRRFG